jgi:hypothetical protein
MKERKIKNMIKTYKTIFASAFAFLAMTGCLASGIPAGKDAVFGNIPRTEPVYSASDPLGVSAIKTNSENIANNYVSMTNSDLAVSNSVAAHVSNTSNPHKVTALQIGAATTNQFVSISNRVNGIVSSVSSNASTLASINSSLSNHVNNVSNPHKVTAAQIGATTTSSFVAATNSFVQIMNDLEYASEFSKMFLFNETDTQVTITNLSVYGKSLDTFIVGQTWYGKKIICDNVNTVFSQATNSLLNLDLRFMTSLNSFQADGLPTALGNKLKSIKISKLVTSIGDYAFHDCFFLTSVTIPAGVTSIGEWAFCSCSSLTSVSIPAGVTSIGGGAFSGCSSLTSVAIPAGVTSIGHFAFNSCSSLASITLTGSSYIAANLTALKTELSDNSGLTISNIAIRYPSAWDSDSAWVAAKASGGAFSGFKSYTAY